MGRLLTTGATPTGVSADRPPTLAGARAALAGLTAGERGTLELLLALPLLPAGALARLDGGTSAATAAARLATLRAGGLARNVVVRPGIASATRPVALWHLTDRGLAVAAVRQGREPHGLARASGGGRAALLGALAALPPLLALYDLAGRLATTGAGYPYLVGWERPWRGVAPLRRAGRRLPARLLLRWAAGPGAADRRATDPCGDWLLLPDDPALPPRRWAATLAWLAFGARAVAVWGERPSTLLIAARGGARCAQWAGFLDAAWGSDRPWPTRVLDLDDPTDLPTPGPRDTPLARRRPWAPALRPRAADRQLPRPVGGPLAPDAPALALGGGDWAFLTAHADHPFLPLAGAAALLGLSADRGRARRDALVAAGLLRVVSAGEIAATLPAGGLPPSPATAAERRRRAALLAAREPAEVTATGLATLARWWGLTVEGAVAWRGVAGGGPDGARGRRGELLRTLEHTVGADALLTRLAADARRYGAALVAWQNAARAWVPGTGVRPDVRGVCRRGDTDWHFWLEYDRARERDAAWREKLRRYYRLRERWSADAGASLAVDLPVWPRLLIVTQAAKDERMIAAAALATAAGRGAPLALLLTTEARALAAPDGLLGAIWRDAAGDGDGRICWQRPPDVGRPFRGTIGRSPWQPRLQVEAGPGARDEWWEDDDDLGRLLRQSPDYPGAR